MHNGEKGIWEKWTLFDEAVKVPLMISHPQSPFQGQHYSQPVELIDVFPTIQDLLMHPFNKENIYKGVKDIPLQGKSLAAVVLGEKLWRSSVTPNRAAKTMVSAPATPANASANGAISM